MKNAIVKLGISLLFLFAGYGAFAAPPTVAITKITTSPTNATSIEFDVLFSEDVTGFTNSDVTLAGVSGTSAAVSTISPSHYKITVTGHSTSGNVTVSIPASSATAVAAPNDPNAASNVETTVFDNVKPTITMAKAGAQADPTSSSPIIFMATFSEPIDPASLVVADVSTTGSTTGGTLTVTAITEIAPMDKTKYEITITLSGGAAGNLAASISAGNVTDPAGNTNTASNTATVAFTVPAKPTIARPTVTGIGETDADLNGNVTAQGSSSVSARGFYYAKNKPGVDNTDTQVPSGTGTGTFTQNITGLTAASHYYVIAYATNGVGTQYSTVRDFWTLSTQPTSAPTPGMTVTSTTAKITFPKASTINAKGYVVLRKKNSEPPTSDLPDGIHPDSLAINSLPANSSLAAIIADDQAIEFNDSGLDPCSDYYYVAVAYNWDGTNPRTTNYRYGGATFNEVHAVTWCNNSTITRNGSALQLDYASKTGSTISSASDGLMVLSLKLRDGGGTSDNDDRKTELASIKIKIDHPEYLKKVAYIDGSYVNAQDPAAVVSFTIPNNTTLANDDGSKDIAIYATFQTGAVIDDQLPIKFEVDEAIARFGVNSAGSGFVDTKAGNANVTDLIDVIATKVNLISTNSPVNPGSNTNIAISVVDDYDHIDKNNAGTITLSKNSGSGNMTGDGGAHALAPTGTYTWTAVKFDQAGTKNVKADHSGSATDLNFDIEVVSLGAAITAPSKSFCFNTTDITPTTFDTFGPIQVAEQDGSDFAAGANQTFSLLLPDGFIFDKTSTPTVTSNGSHIGTTAVFDGYSGNNIVRIKYTTSGSGGGTLDRFTINGLKIKYTKTVAVTDAPILRIGGSAIIAGDSDSEMVPKIHGKLSAPAGGAMVVAFRNGGGVNKSQTGFSNKAAGVLLEGLKAADSSVLVGPGAVFSGDGVVLNGSNYRFNPSTVADGPHTITFAYSDPANSGCVSIATKVYTVFSTVITGLSDTYCSNADAAPLGNPTAAPPNTGVICTDYQTGLLTAQYTANRHIYYYYKDLSIPPFGVFRVLYQLPDQNNFDPKHPDFASEISSKGQIEIVAYYINNCTGGADQPAGNQVVKILKPDPISITNDFDNGVCSTQVNITMTGKSYTSTNGVDEFWSTQVGNLTSTPGITGSRATAFVLEPALANTGSTDKQIDIHYKHLDAGTGCVVTTQKTVSIYGKPATMSAANLTNTGTPNASHPQFCLTENTLGQFSVSNVPGVEHSWTGLLGTNLSTTLGDDFKPDRNDFNLLDAKGNVVAGAQAQFNLRQVTHRNAAAGFAGCSSDPYVVTVDIKKPSTITIDSKGLVCVDNKLDLETLHKSIDYPDSPTKEVWSTVPSIPAIPVGTFTDINGNIVTGLNLEKTAKWYNPSDEEFDAKQFKLRFQTDDPSGPCPADDKIVTIDVNPGTSVSFDPINLKQCAANEISVTTSVTNDTKFTWTTTGGGSIVAGTEKSSKATYSLSQNEKDQGGSVEFIVTTDDPDGTGPCVPVVNNMIVTIDQRPIITADVHAIQKCTDAAQALAIDLKATKPAGLSSADTWNWSIVSATSPNIGTIDDPTFLNTVYHPSKMPVGNTDYQNYENPGTVPAPSTKTIVFRITAKAPAGNTCGNVSDDVTVDINGTPSKPDDFWKAYCAGESIAALDAGNDLLNPKWYKDAGTPGNPTPAATYFVNTRTYTTGTDKDHEGIEYSFLTRTFANCESAPAKYVITVNPLPVASFDRANLCLGEIMQFTSTSTIPARLWDDAVDPAGPRKIATYEWTFGDGSKTSAGDGAAIITDGGLSTSGNYLQPAHKYANAGTFIGRLQLVTNDGCKNIPVDTPITVGTIPVAAFTFDKQCDQDNTVFGTTSSLPPAEETGATYSWDFGDGQLQSGTGAGDKAPIHKFPGVNTYTVSLTIQTALGCQNTVIKQASIFPYIKSFPYVEPFEGVHGWVSEGVTTPSSWTLSASAGAIGPDPDAAAGTNFWATHTNTGKNKVWYYDNERSVIYGPCVDMTNLARPVMALDYFNNTEKGADGAYIEFRRETDPVPTWTRLGDVSSGLNWYKESSVSGLSTLSGVGQNLSQYGWSGSTDGNWVTGRYNMDDFANDTKVRFRIVFGSNSSPILTKEYDGFAFDNFKLETRNRLVLIESFTSKSTSSAVVGNFNAFKAFPASGGTDEVVKIEYHTGLPAVAGDPTDPIFTQNPMDPNARASFYGLSAVPRGYIDGYSGGNGMFQDVSSDWAAKYYSTESLKTSPLSLVIDDPTVTAGVLTIKGTITAKDYDLLANKYSLYVAVVEESVTTSDAFVLRKMLPSASGTKLPLTLKGQEYKFEMKWSVDRAYLSDNPKLIAVAFVQSDIINADKERQVLQAAYNSNVPDVKFNNTTGLEVPFLEQTALYPNPADRLVTVELPEATDAGVEVTVLDQVGRQVQQGSIGVGQKSTTIDTGNLAGAMYIVQLRELGKVTTRKLVIAHKH